MDIIKKIKNGVCELALKGRLDTTTAPELEKELNETYDLITDLIIELKQLDYLSSAGLRALLSAQKKMISKNGTMIVRNPNEEIMEVFEITGFSDILIFEYGDQEPEEFKAENIKVESYEIDEEEGLD